LPLDPRFASSNPGDDDGFLRAINIPQYDFLRKGNKAVDTMSKDFTAC